MKIIVDAFGGDNAPLEILKGSLEAKDAFGVDILFCGDKEAIQACAAENNLDISGVEIKDADGFIPVEEDPMKIRHQYKNSSLAVALRALKDGEGDAVVSAGSTGAVVVGATLFLKRIKGAKPALGVIMPHNEGNFMMIDGGGNTKVTPDALHQFAMMGSIYMEKVMGIANPRVGLANIGAEPNKGTDLQVEAYQIMKNATEYNFIGNAEVRDIPFGGVDVVVADGFTGNIFLKTYEGVAMMLLKNIKNIFMKNTLSKLSYLGVKSGVGELKGKLDYNAVGGAPLIGVQKPVIKAHGSSKAETFKNAIRQAISYAESGAIQAITDNLPKRDAEEADHE